MSAASTPSDLAPEREDRRSLGGYALLGWLIPLALIHGLLYLALVPPWQHYDEPTHFEYAWLVADRGHSPTIDDLDPQMRRDVAASMERFQFYPPGLRLDLTLPTIPILGETQLYHPQLYYAVVALPLRLVAGQPITIQLYTARTISLIIYVLTIVAAWRLTTVVIPDEPLIQLAIPLLFLLTPTFADMMTAVNNDVLVNFCAATLLLGCVLLIRNGLQITPLALATLSLGAGLGTKRTAVILLLPYLIALIWSLRRTKIPTRLLTSVIVLGALIGAFAGLEFGQAADGSRVLTLRPWLNQLDISYLRLSLDGIVRSLGETARLGKLYQKLLEIGFTSFWVRLSWGNIQIGLWADWLMASLCIASGVGLIIQGWRDRGQLPLWQRRCIWLFLLMVVLGCLSMIARLYPIQPPDGNQYIPRGRYIFTIMLPAIWLIALGWQGLLPDRWKPYGPLALLVVWGAIDLVAWSSAIPGFFYGAS